MNVQQMLNEASRENKTISATGKLSKHMDRRKPPVIQHKSWKEQEALEILKSESPGLRQSKLADRVSTLAASNTHHLQEV